MNLQKDHDKLGYEWPLELSSEQREQLLNAKIARVQAWLNSRQPDNIQLDPKHWIDNNHGY